MSVSKVLFHLITFSHVLLSLESISIACIQECARHIASTVKFHAACFHLVGALLVFDFLSLTPATQSGFNPSHNKSMLHKAWLLVSNKASSTLDWMIASTQGWSRRQRGRRSSPMLTGRQVRLSSKWLRFCVMSVVAVAAADRVRNVAETDPFDTDSSAAGIDNRCSGCITHARSDMPGELKECHRIVEGFGGARQFRVWTGTVHWSWEDDQGCNHDFVIPNSCH